MKQITLCADDYGQNAAISQAIIHLIHQNRISATSCLTTFPNWKVYAEWLKQVQNKIDVGLHFNLTEGPSLTHFSMYSLKEFLLRSLFRTHNKKLIEDELNAQLDYFIESMGRYPDYVDGHQHIQQFPQVREVILNIYEKRLRKMKVYIRCPFNRSVSHYFQLKSCALSFLGGKTFKTLLEKANVPTNSSFEGTYPFAKSTSYSDFFPLFLKCVKDNGLIMCHPGLEQSENDPIAAHRFHEYQYLMSNQFVDCCKLQNVIIGRLRVSNNFQQQGSYA